MPFGHWGSRGILYGPVLCRMPNRAPYVACRTDSGRISRICLASAVGICSLSPWEALTMGSAGAVVTGGWPELAWDAWKDTATTLHMWTQIVGKTRLALTPLQNYWWNVPLYVSARGLTTSAMPWRGDVLEIEFDFYEHVLELRRCTGATIQMALEPQSVAEFWDEYREALAVLGGEAKIWPMPVEVAALVRFDQDTAHASYDASAVARFHQALMRVDTLLKRFSTGFQGKISPVHFFWGSFDLA